MAVKLRMKQFGRTNRPEFRIVAADARSPRDGRIIENLGWYHPLETAAEKVLHMDEERIKYWLSVGAQPSETLVSIFKKRGIKLPWIETWAKQDAKKVEARRTAKGKTGKKPAKASAPAAKPAASATPTATAAAAKPATKAQVEEKAKAADSKAAKREAKKAKG
ncbi:MAG TPA: 30S ribosomal protein S16 [Planctomycetota bacterium]|nr:30S ribosomal protein S16 [Planctomycetota bacterium]